MDQKRLQYFITLAKMLHYGAAAEELNIAQSALSRQINVLEDELGCLLFDRANRGNVSLTAAGAAFFVEAQKILTQFDNAKRLASSAARGEAGTLLIDVIPAAVNATRRRKTASEQIAGKRTPFPVQCSKRILSPPFVLSK